MKDILQAVQRHSDAWPFESPVDTTQLRDYLDVVKEPIGVCCVCVCVVCVVCVVCGVCVCACVRQWRVGCCIDRRYAFHLQTSP